MDRRLRTAGTSPLTDTPHTERLRSARWLDPQTVATTPGADLITRTEEAARWPSTARAALEVTGRSCFASVHVENVKGGKSSSSYRLTGFCSWPAASHRLSDVHAQSDEQPASV